MAGNSKMQYFLHVIFTFNRLGRRSNHTSSLGGTSSWNFASLAVGSGT